MQNNESVINKLYQVYETEFERINDGSGDYAGMLEEVTVISRNAILEFNSLAAKLILSDQVDEILYFKRLKPRFFALLIYYEELAYLESNKPKDLPDGIMNFYQMELEVINHFFNRYRFYYEYYRNGMTTLDTQYFTASNKREIHILNYPNEKQTGVIQLDYLFSRFKALEMLQVYIIGRSRVPLITQIETEKNNIGTLRWTGDLINLVELTYGLWLTGQFNHGNASLNQIVRWLEINLNVNIGTIQKRFAEIERRKRLSPTRFIDQMKDFIQRKIDKGQE